MAQTINTNIISLNAQRNLNTSQTSLATSMQRLSSGLRVNSAKDDAAGLAIAERMNTQVRGLNVAARNANDGISLAQTAEGALGKMGDMLQRVRELAVQSANATNSETDRQALNAEVVQLKLEIGRIAEQTQFNGLNLLDGTFTDQAFQVGANQGQTITIGSIANANLDALGTWTSLDGPATTTGAAGPTGTLGASSYATTVTGASAPAVTGAVAGSAAVATTSGTSGAFTSAVSDTIGQNFTFSVGGVEILNQTTTAAVETIAAADLDTALTAATAALTTAGISFTGTAAAGDLAFSRADGTDMAITLTSDFATAAGSFATAGFVGTATNGTEAVAASPGAFAGLAAGDLTINGTDVGVVAAGSTALEQGQNIAAAINLLTTTTGVTATANATTGALTLNKATAGTLIIGGANQTATEASTGLTFATTAEGAATPDATPSFSALAAGEFTITTGGTTYNVLATALADSTATLRVDQLVTSINGLGISGLTASNESGALKIDSTNAFDLGGTLNTAAETGMTSASFASTPGTTQTGLADLDVLTVLGANNAMLAVDAALDAVNTGRGTLGAAQSRFENAISNIQVTAENLSAARGRIMDADFAAETANLSRAQILQQAGTAMVAQANQIPQQVLQLLQG